MALLESSCVQPELITAEAVPPHPSFLLVLVGMYLFAGLQTWRLLFLMDPHNQASPLGHALRRDDPAIYPIMFLFLLAWPVFLFGAWVAVKLVATQAR